jgi:hypothetical protein
VLCEVEQDRLILEIDGSLGLLNASNGPIQTLFGCVGGKLGSHLSHLFKQEHEGSLSRRRSGFDAGDIENLRLRFFGFKGRRASDERAIVRLGWG